MVDLLPAGVISHGLYGGSKWVQNQPTGQSNSWGVLRPGAPLNFTYQPAMVGAGYIACEGKRVCGATMTSDGFGRWSVPSARDLADVFNMIIASNHSYCQYFDMTVDRIFERVNVLGAEVHRLNLALSRSAGAAETVRPSAREDLPVQGQIVEEARQPGGWQPLPPSATLREHSGPCMATGGAWEAMKFAPGQPVPKPPLQRPQTATRPVSMADRRAAVPAPAAALGGPAAAPMGPAGPAASPFGPPAAGLGRNQHSQTWPTPRP